MKPRVLLRKTVSSLASVALACCGLPAVALADASASTGTVFEEGDISYTVTAAQEVSVGAQSTRGGTNYAAIGAVSVPESVVHEGVAYKVTGINDYAFSSGNGDAASITSISLPDTIANIGRYAFNGCSQLSAVTIPVSVTHIGMYAFSNCASLKSVSFEDPTAESPALSCDEGAFCMPTNSTPSLEQFRFPARMGYVDRALLENQTALKSITFEGQSVSYIGEDAFRYCSSVELLEIPELTSGGTKLGNDALYSMIGIKTLIFKGDEDYFHSEYSSTPANNFFAYSKGTNSVYGVNSSTATYPPVERIIYYGTHTSSLFEEAKHYQAVRYYASEADAQAGQGQLGLAVVEDSVLARNATGASSVTGEQLYSGVVPDPGVGMAWHYEGTTLAGALSNVSYAYPVSSADLANGQLFLEKSDYIYKGAPITVEAQVIGADGKTLGSSEYTFSATNATGASVPADALVSMGTYTLKATASGGSYKGSAQATLTISKHVCNWVRYSGDAAYSTSNHMLDSAFKPSSVDTVILASNSQLAEAAAASGLAGARKAPIILTNEDALTLEARRNLNYYNPDSVLLVGFEDASAVQSTVESVLGSEVTISNPFTDATPSGVSYKLYNRTRSAGYWDDSTTAIIAPGSDADAVSLAGVYAYSNVLPVFLADEPVVESTDEAASVKTDISAVATTGATISEDAAKAIASRFDHVLFVGTQLFSTAAVEQQLSAAGFSGTTSRWTGSNIYDLSVNVANELLKNDTFSLNKTTLASAASSGRAATAACTCGENGAPLLFVDETDEGMQAVNALIKPNVDAIDMAYLFALRCELSASFMESLERLWSVGEATDLLLASISLRESSATYTGGFISPTVTVTNSAGAKLVEGIDYEINFCNVDTDKLSLAKFLKDVGTYAVTASGKGDYSGEISSVFEVKPISIANALVSGVNSSYDFTGESIEPAVSSVLFNGKTLGEGTDYTVAYENNTRAGVATVLVSGIGIYGDTVKADFSINLGTAAPKAAVAKKKATVTWTDTGATSYKVQYRLKGKSKWTAVSVTKPKIVLKKLTSKKKYQVCVVSLASGVSKTTSKIITTAKIK